MRPKKKIRIGVAVRVRPFLNFEKEQGMRKSLMKLDYKNQ